MKAPSNNFVNQIRNGFDNIEKKLQEGFYKKDGGVGEYFTYLDVLTDDSKIIVAPQNKKGIEGFVFDVGKDETIDLTNEITQHVVEDRSYISDHIALKPIVYTVGGYVGEIFLQNDIINENIEILQSKLSLLSQFNIPFTQNANSQINKLKNTANKNVNYVKNAYKTGKNILDTYFEKGGPQSLSRIEKAQQFFLYLRNNKIPCYIATKTLGYLDNFFITNVNIKREYATNVGEFNITLQQVNFANTKFTAYNSEQATEAAQYNEKITKMGQGSTKNATVQKSLLQEGADKAKEGKNYILKKFIQ